VSTKTRLPDHPPQNHKPHIDHRQAQGPDLVRRSLCVLFSSPLATHRGLGGVEAPPPSQIALVFRPPASRSASSLARFLISSQIKADDASVVFCMRVDWWTSWVLWLGAYDCRGPPLPCIHRARPLLISCPSPSSRTQGGKDVPPQRGSWAGPRMIAVTLLGRSTQHT